MPTCETAHGRMAYTVNGADDDGRPALLLVHGAGGQARDWPDEWRYRTNAQVALGVPALPKPPRLRCGRVIAIDLPGHGNSDGHAAETVDAAADHVAAFVEAMGLTRVVVAGHSMGGAIALTLAARAPDWLAGLIVIASAARLPVTDQILDGLLGQFDPTVDAITRYSWARSAPEVYREIGRRHMKVCGAKVLHADFAACAGYSVKDRLGNISVPTLVIAGEGDKMVPAKASQSLADAIQDAEFAVIPGAGHFVHFEQTEAVGRLIEGFIARMSPRIG